MTDAARAPVAPSEAAAAAPASAPAPADASEPRGEEAPPGPDDPVIARRDELLTPISSRLSRAIKRTLGDDQNRLLDRLRSAPALEVDELLGEEDEHTAVFAAAARSHLDEAFAAGIRFVGAGAATIPGAMPSSRRRRASPAWWSSPCDDKWPRGPVTPLIASAPPSANGGANGSSGWSVTRRRRPSRPGWRRPARTARCAGS